MEINPAQTPMQTPARDASQTVAAQVQAQAAESLPAQVRPEPARPGGTLNISMRFEKDEESGKLVLYIVDRESKKVLRTIPPEVLAQLTAGQVLNLTA